MIQSAVESLAAKLRARKLTVYSGGSSSKIGRRAKGKILT